MIISLIVAASENNVIGKDNHLPWHLPVDLKFFKDKTMGHCVVMGRKNYDSIPLKYRPLSGRTNIVVTKNKNLRIDDCIVVHSLEEAFATAKNKNETECFVIGGGEIFKHAIGYCDKIYLTRIHAHIEGDVFFPVLNKNDWKEVNHVDYKKDERHQYDFSFIELERVT